MEEEIKIEYVTKDYVTDKEISDLLKEYIDPVKLKFSFELISPPYHL